MRKSNVPQKLNSRALEILGHGTLYGLTTDRVLEQLYFHDGSIQGMKSLLGRLVDREGTKFLKARSGANGVLWYEPTERAYQVLGEDARPVELSVDELALDYGALAYCCLGKCKRRLYSKEEFARDFPELAFDKYCLEAVDGEPKLTCIRVAMNISELPGICQELAIRAEAIPALLELLKARRFTLALVTAETEITRQEMMRNGIPIDARVEIAPELPAFISAFRERQPPRLFE